MKWIRENFTPFQIIILSQMFFGLLISFALMYSEIQLNTEHRKNDRLTDAKALDKIEKRLERIENLLMKK